MSNLLKSKFLMGVMVAAFVLVGVAAVNAGDASADCSITMTLRLGSSGAEVMCLQGKVGAGVDGKFGPMTLNAVKVWQAAHGLMADGVVGPMTRNALMGAPSSGGQGSLPSGCMAGWMFNPADGKPCTSTGGNDNGGNTGGLQGGAGDITIDALSTYGDEEVGEGEEDVKVLAFEIEADDESDIEITSVKVEMNQQNTADDEDLDAYGESVSVWMGSEKVGEADVEDFSEASGQVWSKSISLDDAVIEAGETEKFYLAVTALSNLDSGDIDSDDWQIGVSSIRFLDGEGVTSTESLTLDIDDNQVDDTLEEEFDFADFATASDVELKVALNESDDDINEAHVINVDDADDTDDVEVLSFTIEAEGSDLNITEIPVLFTTTGETDEAVILISARLWLDDEEIGTESVPTGGAVTFDDLDVDISEGDEAEFKVTVDLQDVNGALDDGDGVKAELTGTQVDAIEAEDESGEDLAAADLTGTALGEESIVYDVAFTFELVSMDDEITTEADPATAGSDTTATYTIKYKLTAFDGDVNIDKSCVEDGSQAADEGISYVVSDAGNNSSSCTVNSTATTATGDSDAWTIDEGDSETFTLTVAVTSSADSFAKIYLESINWESDTTTPDTSPDLFFTAGLGEDDTSTDTVFLNTI